MIESAIEKLTAAIERQTAVGEQLIAALANKTPAATPAPAPAKEKAAPKPKPVPPPEPEPPAEEPAAEAFPTDRAAGLDLIAEAFKTRLNAKDADRQAVKDAFTAIRAEFEVETIHNLEDAQVEAFYNAVIEKM